MATTDEQRQILVINDTPELLDLFRDIPGEEGHQITTDSFPLNTTAKLAEIKADAPDLIIGGEPLALQFLQILRMDRETRHIPEMICTAAHRQAAEMEAHLRELGVAVVLKPFDLDHLLAEIAKTWAEPEA